MKLKPGSYFLMFLIILAVVFLVEALTYTRLQARMLPVIASSILIVVGTIQLFLEIKGEKEAVAIEEQLQMGTATLLRRFGLIVLWIGGFAVASYLLGFLISVPLYLVSFLKWQRTRWLVAIIIAVATTAAIYGLFEFFLLRTLWRGVLPIPWWVIPFL